MTHTTNEEALAHLWQYRKAFRDYFNKHNMTAHLANLDALEKAVGDHTDLLDSLVKQYGNPERAGSGKVVDRVIT